MARCYFDTSAVAKLVREERYTHDVARWVDDPGVEAVSSLLLETELRRVVDRWGIAQQAATETLEHFDLHSIPDWEFSAAGLVPVPGVRSLDALHVAAAIRVEADAIASSGGRMIEAAMAMGLAVVQPGVDRDGEIRRIDVGE